MNSVPLYVKTSYSLLSSLCDIKCLISKCKELGIKSIAITDPNMYGVMDFYKECKKNDIKPIIGFELTIDNNVVLLYAKNYLGYQNLTRLCFIKQNKDINIDDLKKYSDNIICIVNNKNIYSSLKGIYKNIYILELNEVLCLEKSDIEYLKYLYLIRDGKKISDIDNYVINENCYLSYNLEDNIKVSNEIADMCNIIFEPNNNLLPKYNSDKDFNAKKYLFELCKKGLYKRFDSHVTQVYYDRLMFELDVINNMGFNDYFLVVWDFIKYSKKNNILIGSGRGSAAGSLVAFSLGITEVDPIKYGLLFERFLNPERISMPDIDIDFESNNRGKVVDYVINKYGNKNAVPIITFSTLGGKQVIRDVGRIFDIDTKALDVICKYIDNSLEEDKSNLKLIKYLDDNDLNDMFNICLKLDGLKRQISTHAAGIIISNLELDSYIPLQKYDDNYISGFSMEHLEELGLLKMDFLGLKNLTLIENVLESINDKELNYNNIPIDDKKSISIFTEAMTEGIFQFESPGMKQFLLKLKPNCFDDIVAAVALFRPGPSENIDSYIKRKQGTENIEYIHKDLSSILESTYGIIIYQEQIMQIAHVMADYSLGEADVLRRAMSKKKKEMLDKDKDKFISRSIKKGYTVKIATDVFDLILKFANYGFNKSHSVAYSMIAIKMAYLKSHYSEYFMSALLTNAIGNDIKTKEYIDECKKMNINVFKPDINISEYKYIKESNGIRFSLSTIKNVGGMSSKYIIDERKKGSFIDFFDFVSRTYGSINKKTIESLIDADCFDTFWYNHNTLYNSIDSAINYADLTKHVDQALVEKPIMVVYDEFDNITLSSKEIDTFGFYLSNHPILSYKAKYKDITNTNEVINNFDKNINMVLFIDRIREINTKDNKKMAFLSCSDEFGNVDVTIFPKYYDLISNLKQNDVIYIVGHVEKRMSKYQVVVNKMEKL